MTSPRRVDDQLVGQTGSVAEIVDAVIQSMRADGTKTSKIVVARKGGGTTTITVALIGPDCEIEVEHTQDE